MPVTQRLRIGRDYLFAFVATMAVVAVRLSLDSLGLEKHAPFLLFALPILISAWVGGLGPGLLATFLSLLAIGVLPQHRGEDPPLLVVFAIEGVLISWLGASRKKVALAMLHSREERLRALLASVRDYSIMMLDVDGCVLSANPGAEHVEGYSPPELIGQNFSMLYPREEVQSGKPRDDLRAAAETGHFESEAWLVRKNGARILCSLVITPIRDAAGALTGFSRVTRDITARHRAEQAIREREALLGALFESSPDAILVVNRAGRIERVNAQTEAVFGYQRDELLQQPLETLVPERFRDAHAHDRQAYQRDPQARPMGAGLELHARRKDGSEFQVDIMLSPVQTSQGLMTIAVVRDITERKRAEQALNMLNAQLQASNRELQDFASVASHDLQEPLRKIQAFGDRLAKSAPLLGLEARDYLERMQNAAGRMRTLIEDLLTFSRVATRALPFQPVDLGQVAREVLSDLEATVAGSNARIAVEKLPVIDADPTQMRQLLQNLISNAVKFAKPDQPPMVRVTADLASSPVNGEMVQLRVEDNGIGFDEKYLDRIFSLFQRLHGRDAYEGTGIGLAVCRKIAERHHGSITARSTPGAGATFIVNLPLHQRGGGQS